MAMHPVYKKDNPERFIDGALTGGGGPPSHTGGYQDSMTSHGMHETKVDRKNQTILTAIALDNVGKVYNTYETSMADMGGVAGGPENLEHSLSGCKAVNEGVGAAGHVKHVIIPNH
jgi:hypothetical protein